MSWQQLKFAGLIVLFLCFNAPLAHAAAANKSRDAVMLSALREQELSRTLAQAESLQGIEKKQPIPQKEYIEPEEGLKEKGQDLKKFLTQVKVHPYLTTRFDYNDNIFRLPQGGESDEINTTKPGLKFVWGDIVTSADKNRIEVDLGLKRVSYYHNSHLTRNYPAASLSAQFGRGKNKLMFRQAFEKEFSTTSDIILGTGGLSNYDLQKTTFDYEYGHKHFGIDLGFDRADYVYAGQYKKGSSYTEQVGSLTAYVQPTGKTRFFAEGDYGYVGYDKFGNPTKDSEYIKGFVGVNGKITEKTSGVIKGGYQMREFKDKVSKDMNNWAAEINLENKFSSRTTFLLEGSRGSLTSTYQGDGTKLDTDFYLGMRHAFTPRLGLNLGYAYAIDKYRSGRKDQIYTAITELKYNFRKWLTMDLGYKYAERDSRKSTSDADYANNIFSLGAGVIF